MLLALAVVVILDMGGGSGGKKTAEFLTRQCMIETQDVSVVSCNVRGQLVHPVAEVGATPVEVPPQLGFPPVPPPLQRTFCPTGELRTPHELFAGLVRAAGKPPSLEIRRPPGVEDTDAVERFS